MVLSHEGDLAKLCNRHTNQEEMQKKRLILSDAQDRQIPRKQRDSLAIMKKESQSNDTLLLFVEFSNVDNSDRSSNASQSSLAYKNV